MGAPFDKSFKLWAAKDELGLLRVVAKLPIPENARIESLDRELDLPTLRVDHLYRISTDDEVTLAHLEAYAQYDSDWRRRHARYGSLIWAKYQVKLRSLMFLLTDRGVPKTLDDRFEIDAGDLGLHMRVRIVRMWEVPASDLLATGDPALMAWVPLTNVTPSELRKAAQAVARSGDAELKARMVLLSGLRYLGSEVLEMMLSEEILKESSYYQKILKKGLEQGLEQGREEGRKEGLLDGEQRLLRKQFVLKFGPLPIGVDEMLKNASDADLERWGTQLLNASSLDEAIA